MILFTSRIDQRSHQPGNNVQDMASQPKPPWRSHRWPGHDYQSGESYFVTICKGMWQPLFGAIVDAVMVLSQFGSIADEEWDRTCELRPLILPHAHCIMPNHVHLLFSINLEVADQYEGERSASRGLQSNSVGSIIGGYKAAVSRRIRLFIGNPDLNVWQRNYHDHVVRNECDFDRIAGYIVNNPAAWQNDKFHPGNAAADRRNEFEI
jgi:putative transposase